MPSFPFVGHFLELKFMMLKKAFFFITSVYLLIFPQLSSYAQKTDTIYHINGNVLTGDLKKLDYGVVSWSMDGMGTISFEEVKVNTLISKKQFQIKMISDLIYFGSFSASEEPRTVFIILPDRKVKVRIEEIVEVYPIKRNFWMRTSGSFSLGLNYSKGSNVATVAFSGNLTYRQKKSYYNLSWDDNNTFQGDSLSSTKWDVGLSWQRNIYKTWSAQTAFGPSQNSELGTKLRWELNLMAIKDLNYSSWNRLYIGGGFSAVRETPYCDGSTENDLAAIFQVVWKVYKFTSPKIWVDTNISYLPYLTDSRYRTVFNLNPKISVINDNFTVGFTSYYNFDSDPSENANSSEDYGLNLQLSYSLH